MVRVGRHHPHPHLLPEREKEPLELTRVSIGSSMNAIITLTTDFGLSDSYVAQMKGVMLGINPQAQLVDICHTIPPQNVLQGAFVLSTAVPYFPPGTVHLVVVDPGVGTERRAIVMKTPSASFVAPDNGVLSYVMESCPDFEAFAISRQGFWRTPVSPTFHGRDIFAPVAARLSLGHAAIEFGEKIASVVRLPLSSPRRISPATVAGNVIHIDRFGNMVTNIRGTDLPRTGAVSVEIEGARIRGLSRTYGEGEGLVALLGSGGYLEIALKDGCASALLGGRIGSEVVMRGEENELPGVQEGG